MTLSPGLAMAKIFSTKASGPEMQPWLSESAHEVVVNMDDGERRTFRPRNPERFHVGRLRLHAKARARTRADAQHQLVRLGAR